MDKTTVVGVLLGLGGILVGNAMEGGHLSNLMQLTAFLIVFAGTIGAMLVGSTEENVRTGMELLKWAFSSKKQISKKEVLDQVIAAAQIARNESVLSLEKQLHKYKIPFMKEVFKYAVDGLDSKVLQELGEEKIELEKRRLMGGAKIWTDAGGYAPTIGILGAVLGLIHVMSNLSDTSQLGAGIAVAFVATIYGVASANLVFLPLGNKIKQKVQEHTQSQYMILEGAVSIVLGQSSYVVEQKMRAFIERTGE